MHVSMYVCMYIVNCVVCRVCVFPIGFIHNLVETSVVYLLFTGRAKPPLDHKVSIPRNKNTLIISLKTTLYVHNSHILFTIYSKH